MVHMYACSKINVNGKERRVYQKLMWTEKNVSLLSPVASHKCSELIIDDLALADESAWSHVCCCMDNTAVMHVHTSKKVQTHAVSVSIHTLEWIVTMHPYRG
jgi:hypothetical protein